MYSNFITEIGGGLVENIVEKGENAGYQHFSPFPTIFSKGVFSGLLKVVIVCQMLMLRGRRPSKDVVGNGDNAAKQHYLHASPAITSTLHIYANAFNSGMV